MGEPTGYCMHCKRSDIPNQNLDIHVIHCKRNAVTCPECGLSLPRALLEEHHESTHAQLPCPQCKEPVQSTLLDNHVTDSCPMRQLECCYCQLSFARKDLAEHVTYCGSRTEHCPLCSRFVMLKDMLRHEESNCGFPPQLLQPPPHQLLRPNAAAVSASHLAAASVGHPSWLQRLEDGSMSLGEEAFGAARADAGVQQGAGIPCEFCHQTFGAPEIMDHQISCIQSIMRDPQVLATSVRSTSSASGSGDTVLDRLLSTMQLAGPQSANGFSLDNAYLDDVVAADMVPCEFCSACLPMDLLPHHQDVCARLPGSLRSTRQTADAARPVPGSRERMPAAAASAARRSPAGATRRRPAQDAMVKMLLERTGHSSAARAISHRPDAGGSGDAGGGGSGSRVSAVARSLGHQSGAQQQRPPVPFAMERVHYGTPTRHSPTAQQRQQQRPPIATQGGASLSLAAAAEARLSEEARARQPEVRQGSARVAPTARSNPARVVLSEDQRAATVADAAQPTGAAAPSSREQGGRLERGHGGVPMRLTQHVRGDTGRNAAQAPRQWAANGGASTVQPRDTASVHARHGYLAPKVAELAVAGGRPPVEAPRTVVAVAVSHDLASGAGGPARAGSVRTAAKAPAQQRPRRT